jgi:hypothetical protein
MYGSRFNSSYERKSTNWKDSLNHYRGEVNKAKEYDSILTPFERISLGEYLQELSQKTQIEVIPAVTQEFVKAKENYKIRESALQNEKAKEINRWDAGKLNAEMDLTKSRLESILRSNLSYPEKKIEIESLIKEANESGDITKQRATAERLLNIADHVEGSALDKMEYNRYSNQAKKMIEDIRTTEEIKTSNESLKTAAEELLGKRKELDSIAQTFYGDHAYFDYVKEFSKVASDVDFDVVKGELKVSILDNPGS